MYSILSYHQEYCCQNTLTYCGIILGPSHPPLTCSQSPDGWCQFCSILFLTLDWGGDQGLPGLPADCVWSVWLHFQTQPVHKTGEVPGGPGRLGPSRKGNQTSSCFSHMVKNVNDTLTKSRWRFNMLICDIISMEILEPLQTAKWKSMMCRPREHIYCNEWVLFCGSRKCLLVSRDSTPVLLLSAFAVKSNSHSLDQLCILIPRFCTELVWERAGLNLA